MQQPSHGPGLSSEEQSVDVLFQGGNLLKVFWTDRSLSLGKPLPRKPCHLVAVMREHATQLRPRAWLAIAFTLPSARWQPPILPHCPGSLTGLTPVLAPPTSLVIKLETQIIFPWQGGLLAQSQVEGRIPEEDSSLVATVYSLKLSRSLFYSFMIDSYLGLYGFLQWHFSCIVTNKACLKI